MLAERDDDDRDEREELADPEDLLFVERPLALSLRRLSLAAGFLDLASATPPPHEPPSAIKETGDRSKVSKTRKNPIVRFTRHRQRFSWKSPIQTSLGC